jgi:type IV pilus assembly protein PilQ
MVTATPASKAAALQDDFSFSGYKKQRISVDFYKIDIHNVFRLFRQVTNLNIIVDEQVQGVLTLALTDVPWDFALDIILNLMDLKKEERFNTIVIYPTKKEFVWPTRAEDNLDFKADIDVIEQESLVIEKSTSQSKEVMQAKELMGKAQNLETREEFEDAALLYSKAFELWPENTKISNRLATLYLVNLGMNAKAVYFAKESLKRDPQNANAALYAAIGSANMQRISEAKEYFAQSISNSPPMKEALMSFAAFSENNGQNDAALKLLNKYHSHYGENLDTMVAKARILDKLGMSKDAVQQYGAILTSGFQLRPDLKKYIEGRLAAKDLQ